MFDWLRSMFRRTPRQTTPSLAEALGGESQRDIGRRTLELDDAAHIEAALTALAEVGLRLTAAARELPRETADELAEQWEGITFGEEPGLGDWALIALRGEFGAFENAIFIEDHCFDGVLLEGFGDVALSIAGLAQEEWPTESVEVTPISTSAVRSRIIVKINGSSPIAPFEMVAAKDFDWTVIARLNERLPSIARGRFAIFHDGGSAIIVYLPPENIGRLNSLCGYEFIFDERLAGRLAQA